MECRAGPYRSSDKYFPRQDRAGCGKTTGWTDPIADVRLQNGLLTCELVLGPSGKLSVGSVGLVAGDDIYTMFGDGAFDIARWWVVDR